VPAHSSDVAKMAAKMAGAGVAMRSASRKAVQAGTVVVATSVRQDVASVTHGGILRGVGKAGARVGARYDVKEINGVAVGLVKGFGPLWLVEKDTKAGERIIKRGKRRGTVINHPGTKGKHPFDKGVDRSKDAAARTMREVLTVETAKALR
jgi:hypothetical protein